MLTKETGAVWQGGAFAPHKVSPQANLGGGGIHFRRAFQISTDTIKKATPIRCGLFYGGDYWTRTSDLLRVKQAL